ncbi:expressed unknown protein [Seminavis robusta]|uniref:Uncharacterized protein n=1 Tax=Seminavis robusta TaxID=568900 RepID=A0A9N8DW79_9STRA|nr:expressed unknown protein [Seminavis robusta]|eukprot:Sro341_g121490.1 n/a (105) ;mRNA; f:44925-45239
MNQFTDENSLNQLRDFAGKGYNKTRRHVLLGQALLNSMVSIQGQAAFVICTRLPVVSEMNRVHQFLGTLEKPEGFDDLEDDDHDADVDFEDYFDPFNEDELMDE